MIINMIKIIIIIIITRTWMAFKDLNTGSAVSTGTILVNCNHITTLSRLHSTNYPSWSWNTVLDATICEEPWWVRSVTLSSYILSPRWARFSSKVWWHTPVSNQYLPHYCTRHLKFFGYIIQANPSLDHYQSHCQLTEANFLDVLITCGFRRSRFILHFLTLD